MALTLTLLKYWVPADLGCRFIGKLGPNTSCWSLAQREYRCFISSHFSVLTLQARPCGAFSANSLPDGNGFEAQSLGSCVWDREQFKKATGDSDSQHELLSWIDSKILLEKKKQQKKPGLLESSGLSSWNFHTITLLGIETFSGKKVSKRQSWTTTYNSNAQLWEAKSVGSSPLHYQLSWISMRPIPRLWEKKKPKSAQNVLELAVVWHLVSEGRLL